MSFVSSPPPSAVKAQPLPGGDVDARDLNALWSGMQEGALPHDADLWPRAVRLGTIGLLSLASWGLLLGLGYGLRSVLG
ncbi:hypothetical protein [Novosphingobium terrae]|uniref:hypothetical protein n=1 Tax=Novosphingobium terrae TaxID=2726189 RepID=UPI001981385B|nr:hypothetical protein [Novosphingobium terrae]